MILASYKSIRPGLSGIFSRAVRWWTASEYSHTEIIFSDGMSGSSSFLDKGVRFKEIIYDLDKWDFTEIVSTPEQEQKTREWFEKNQGKGYDILGLFGLVWKRGTQNKNKYYCNEAIGEALGIKEPWRYDPAGFKILVENKYGRI